MALVLPILRSSENPQAPTSDFWRRPGPESPSGREGKQRGDGESCLDFILALAGQLSSNWILGFHSKVERRKKHKERRCEGTTTTTRKPSQQPTSSGSKGNVSEAAASMSRTAKPLAWRWMHAAALWQPHRGQLWSKSLFAR